MVDIHFIQLATTRFFLFATLFFGSGSNVAERNPKFPKIGLSLPDKIYYLGREQSFDKVFRVQFSIFSEKIGKLQPNFAFKSVAYKNQSNQTWLIIAEFILSLLRRAGLLWRSKHLLLCHKSTWVDKPAKIPCRFYIVPYIIGFYMVAGFRNPRVMGL